VLKKGTSGGLSSKQGTCFYRETGIEVPHWALFKQDEIKLLQSWRSIGDDPGMPVAASARQAPAEVRVSK
jgi:hypothetical protein